MHRGEGGGLAKKLQHHPKKQQQNSQFFGEKIFKLFFNSASHITIIGTILPWKNLKKSKF